MGQLGPSQIRTVKTRKPLSEYTPDEIYNMYMAFMSLMLFKIGGIEAISFDMLDSFPVSELPNIKYNAAIDGLVMTHPKSKLAARLLKNKAKSHIVQLNRKIITNPLDLIN